MIGSMRVAFAEELQFHSCTDVSIAVPVVLLVRDVNIVTIALKHV